MTLFGVKLAPHTIGALLMLMGWSVDSEVLFDTKILKSGKGDPKERALKAMKTAMTMSAAIFASLSALYIVSTSSLIQDIALVMMLGALFDIINTWFQSLSMVLWYAERESA
jgi:preprotein translocase subunit SecF